jgi:hypothetical protein
VARPGIVHRIDKDTSGLLVVAKTDAAHEGLARQFADHSIERAYRAIVAGHPMPTAGTVRGAIARSSANRKKMALVEEGRGKHAVTHYRTLERLDGAALVECRLETGRTHQVRVHMASIGHIRYWVILFMDALLHGFGRSSTLDFSGRRFMRRNLASSTPLWAWTCILPVRCPPTWPR